MDKSDAIEDTLCRGDNLGGQSNASSLLACCACSLWTWDSTPSRALKITARESEPIPEKATYIDESVMNNKSYARDDIVDILRCFARP
jgi:hypothetical protein